MPPLPPEDHPQWCGPWSEVAPRRGAPNSCVDLPDDVLQRLAFLFLLDEHLIRRLPGARMADAKIKNIPRKSCVRGVGVAVVRVRYLFVVSILRGVNLQRWEDVEMIFTSSGLAMSRSLSATRYLRLKVTARAMASCSSMGFVGTNSVDLSFPRYCCDRSMRRRFGIVLGETTHPAMNTDSAIKMMAGLGQCGNTIIRARLTATARKCRKSWIFAVRRAFLLVKEG